MTNHTEYGETENRQSRANPVDTAWLAGIMDGEGSLSSSWVNGSTEHLSVHFKISNCAVVLMEKVQRIILAICGVKYKIGRHSDVNGKRCYSIEPAKQRSVQLLCQALLPYLTCKKAQAEAMIAFCQSRRVSRRRRGSGYSDNERGLYLHLKALKVAQFTFVEQGSVTTECVAPRGDGI